MKKSNLFILVLSSALLLSGCGNQSGNSSSGEQSESSEVETLTLNKTSLTLALGQTFLLSASDPSVSYVSSSPDVANVDSSGLVTGVSLGSSIITASVGEKKAYAKVIVTDKAQSALSVSFSSSSLALYEGEKFSFPANVSFDGKAVEGATLEYGSTDPEVLTFSDGELLALKKGSASVYVKANYDGYSGIAYAAVEVLAITMNISPNFRARNVVVGEEGLTLSFTLMKGNDEVALTSPITYSLDNEALAEIQDGVLIGKKKGKVNLTASTIYDGEEVLATLPITVNEKVTLSFYDDDTLLKSYDILNGQSLTLNINNPKKDGYVFRNFVDDDGNVFSEESVFEESAVFRATYLARTGKMDGAIATVAKAIDIENVSCPDLSGWIEDESGVMLHLQKEGVASYEITLPAYDFNSASRVDFVLVNNYGSDGWGTIKAGENSFAYNSTNLRSADAYVVSDGTKASFYVGNTYLTTYDEDVSSGKKGLTFTFERQLFNTYQELFVGDFTTYAYDYRAKIDEAIASIPEDLSSLSDEQARLILDAYGEATSYFTPYEASHYAEDEKISALRNLLKGKTFALFTLPDEYNWETVGALGISTDGSGFQGSASSNWLGINLQDGGVSKGVTQYIEFPKVNFANFSSVSFKVYHNYSGAYVKIGEQTLIEATTADEQLEINFSTSEGKTSISCGSVSIELDDEMAKGKKSLRFDITRERDLNMAYDSFFFTPFAGTY